MAVDANQILAQMAQAQMLGQYQRDANRALYGSEGGAIAAQMHMQAEAAAAQAMYSAKPWMFPAGNIAPVTSPAYRYGPAAPMVPAEFAGDVPFKPVIGALSPMTPYGLPASNIGIPPRLAQHVTSAGFHIGGFLGSLATWWAGSKILGGIGSLFGLGGLVGTAMGAVAAAPVMGLGLLAAKGVHQAAYWDEALAQLSAQGALPFMGIDAREQLATKLHGTLRGIADKYFGMTTNDVAAIFKMGAQNDLFAGATNMKELVDSIKDLTKNIRKVSDLTGTTLQESMRLYMSLKSTGLGVGNIDQLYGLATTAGPNTQQGMDTLVKTVSGWEQLGRQSGMNVTQLKTLGMQTAQGIGYAGYAGLTGAIPKETLWRWTGQVGRAGGVAFHQKAESVAQRLLGSKLGQIVLMAGYNPETNTWESPKDNTLNEIMRDAERLRHSRTFANYAAHREQIVTSMLAHPEETVADFYRVLNNTLDLKDPNKRRIFFKRYTGVDMDLLEDITQAEGAMQLAGITQPVYAARIARERRFEAERRRYLSPSAWKTWLWEHTGGKITQPIESWGAGIYGGVERWVQDKMLEALGETRQTPAENVIRSQALEAVLQGSRIPLKGAMLYHFQSPTPKSLEMVSPQLAALLMRGSTQTNAQYAYTTRYTPRTSLTLGAAMSMEGANPALVGSGILTAEAANAVVGANTTFFRSAVSPEELNKALSLAKGVITRYNSLGTKKEGVSTFYEKTEGGEYHLDIKHLPPEQLKYLTELKAMADNTHDPFLQGLVQKILFPKSPKELESLLAAKIKPGQALSGLAVDLVSGFKEEVGSDLGEKLIAAYDKGGIALAFSTYQKIYPHGKLAAFRKTYGEELKNIHNAQLAAQIEKERAEIQKEYLAMEKIAPDLKGKFTDETQFFKQLDILKKTHYSEYVKVYKHVKEHPGEILSGEMLMYEKAKKLHGRGAYDVGLSMEGLTGVQYKVTEAYWKQHAKDAEAWTTEALRKAGFGTEEIIGMQEAHKFATESTTAKVHDFHKYMKEQAKDKLQIKQLNDTLTTLNGTLNKIAHLPAMQKK